MADQVTFGAYLVLIGQVIVGLPFWVSVSAAMLLWRRSGAVIYGGFMWPLRNASLLARIIASLALGTVLREFLRAYMGPSAWPFPFLLSPTAVSIGGVLVVPANLAIVGVSHLSAFLASFFFCSRRRFMAKPSWPFVDNQIGASLVGVRVSCVPG